MAVTSSQMEQTITLEETKPSPVRRLSTKEAALRMLRDLSTPQNEEF